MRFSKRTVTTAVAAICFMLAAGSAVASHGKVGLWSITITVSGDSQMPDMSKLPPEAQARMKAMGMSTHGNSMTVQHCMAAQEVATDVPKLSGRNMNDCKMVNVQHIGHTMSADMTCSGNFQGTGHVQFTYDSDTHYTGEVTMTGTANGHPVNHDQKMEGRWLSADCGSFTH